MKSDLNNVAISQKNNENVLFFIAALMGVVPVLIYKKVDLSIVRVKYFHLMTSSLLLAFIMALIARLAAQFLTGRNTNVNPKGNFLMYFM